jgi:23S rRNA-/tRNA-specific pseudouridylate synthase
VHRLDTGTSGVLVFAAREEAWRRARERFQERAVDKRYVARTHGAFRASGEANLRLAHRGDHMAVVRREGRESRTWLRLIETDGETSLIEARPVTGLMHQIRVTLAHLGHPIVGDRVYGSAADLDRHLLHATSIQIGDFLARSTPPPELRGRR